MSRVSGMIPYLVHSLLSLCRVNMLGIPARSLASVETNRLCISIIPRIVLASALMTKISSNLWLQMIGIVHHSEIVVSQLEKDRQMPFKDDKTATQTDANNHTS